MRSSRAEGNSSGVVEARLRLCGTYSHKHARADLADGYNRLVDGVHAGQATVTSYSKSALQLRDDPNDSATTTRAYSERRRW